MDFRYPYTDMHELNLDWFLEEFKKYYEKVIQQDEKISLQNEKIRTLDGVVTEFTNFVTNYFDNLDVQQEINNKLDAMVADGTLKSLLEPVFSEYVSNITQAVDDISNDVAVLDARMDTFTHLTDGSTTGDAELADIRVGWNGVTYTDAGTAVRTCDSILDHISYPFIIDQSMIEQGQYQGSTGIDSASNRIRLKQTIKVQKGQRIIFSIGSLYWMIWELSSSSRAGGNAIRSESWNQNPVYYVRNDCWLMLAIANGKTAAQSTTIHPADFAGYTVRESGTIMNEKADLIYPALIDNTHFIQAQFTTAGGIEESTKRIITPHPIRVEKGRILSMDVNGLYWMTWELSSNSTAGNNVLTAVSWNQDPEYLVRNDCWLIIGLATAATSSASTTITPSSFTGSIRCLGNVESRPSYVFRNYHQLRNDTSVTKIKDFVAKMEGLDNYETFLFFTDSHWLNESRWQEKTSDNLTEIGGIYNTAPVNFAIYGGDALSGTSPYNEMTKEVAMYYLAIYKEMCDAEFGDCHMLVGNHDYNYQADDLLSEQDMINCWYRKEKKSYYSFDGYNSKVYCLNTGLNRRNSGQGDYNVQMDAFKWQQIDWLGTSLISDDPAHVIIAMHIIINNSVLEPFCLYTEANELCAAYNNRQTITKNSITYDFTGCTGKVELFIGGHLHTDDYYGLEYGITDGIPYVVRATDHTIPATFDIILCDWDAQTAFFKKFGTGSDLLLDLTTGQPIT